MKKLLFISVSLLTFTCCRQQPRTTTGTTDSTETPVQLSAVEATADTATAATPAISPEKLVSAGKGIGKINLGTNTEALGTLLGKPDFSDAAMGKAWLTWYSKKRDEHNNRNELNIFVSYADSTMRTQVVKQIRVTSPFYLTGDSLQVYNDLARIRQVYPALVLEGKYKEQEGGREIFVYDAVDEGIAFEVAKANEQEICISMIVHEPGRKVRDIYITFRPDMKKV